MPECFIIMPITTPQEAISKYGGDKDHFIHILEHLFKPAIEKISFAAIPPSASGSDIIHAEIIKQLETADIVLCDMSMLNPNVFFELGIRTAVDKPIALVKDQLTATVPFDTRHINYHIYDQSLAPWLLNNEIQSLADHLLKSVNRSEGHNTLWRYFGLTTRASLEEQKTTIDEKLNMIIHHLQGLTPAIPQLLPPSVDDDAGIIISWIVSQAQRMASEVNAELFLKEADMEKITFDLRHYLLTADIVERIKELGEKYEITIDIIGIDPEGKEATY